MEKSNLTCTCRAKMGKSHNVTWPGHSQSGSLSLTNVQRSDNGTRYTCRLTAKGVEEEAVYTLRVAYGPYDGQVSISPSQSIRNGTQPVTVTCNAEDTYPTPYYQWGGVLCQNPSSVNTCTFIPDPSLRHGGSATCRAESVTLSDPKHTFDASVRGTASHSPRLNITFIPECGEDFVANSSAQYIESPGYPTSYANNQYCVWHITAPRGQVLWLSYERMNIECDDFAEVFEGDERSGKSFGQDCKYSWSPYQTTDGLMTLTFNTDYRRKRSYYRGFRAVFKTIPTCGGNIEVNRTTQTIQSPGYPERYMNNMKCVWNITAKPGFYIRFNFTDFGIQKSRRCRWDSVKLRDGEGERGQVLGTYCGDKKDTNKAKFKAVTSYTNNATIVFETSPGDSGRGFSLQIEATKSCNGRLSWECSSGQCVYGTDRCDGKIDCDDGSDEQNCVSA
ncbi:bone morphogenetic protein 1-like isoform X1 [Littorina saxatilis]|uniref:bone morphogenetic protein 1-like isoform X1 n=1 Tax=Littorina saxatilis TaxID=31220 RepID=UPI0038B447F3